MKIVDGIKFKCTKCGKCCKWEGKVSLLPSDINKLANVLSLKDNEFLNRYTKKYGNHIILRDKPGTSECVFLKNNKCSVWDHQPKQCSDFPKEYDKRCPGFSNINGSPVMSNKFALAIKEVNKKLANSSNYEKALYNGVYRDLDHKSKSASVLSVATVEGIDHYLENNNSIKVASLDDLFSFDRVSKDHLIHKCNHDLWQIDTDKEGNVQITRLFDETGDPIKG
jgi:uncharacterized protein